jgi:uncharacterized membrane protein YbhN (UPF0104 family)
VRRRVGHATPVRIILGCAISVVLLAVTLGRVDLPAAAAAIGAAAPGLLLLAVAVVLGDLGLRTVRWRVLLGPLSATGLEPPFRAALGYISIGYLTNGVLPARLGDVARAYLAADAFGLGRLSTFGTIVVERVADGLTMLGLALLSVVAVGAVGAAGDLVVIGLIAVAVGIAGLGVAWIVLDHPRIGRSRIGSLARSAVARIGEGAAPLREVRTFARFATCSASVTLSALVVAWAVTRSVGLDLSPMELTLFVSAVALSLAIPAAPGAIGTYEFVGVAILTSVGSSPELALATMILMRVVTTLPLIGAGIVSLWALQLRPSALVGNEVRAGS